MNKTLLDISRQFWEAMEHADEVGMRACAHPDCNFVHIGITCKLDKEIEFYTSGAFQPTNITFHSQKAELFGDTGVVLTDCDYSLLLGGKETTHHFMVTEVYTQDEKRWKLVTFSFYGIGVLNRQPQILVNTVCIGTNKQSLLGGFIYGIRNFEQRNQNAHGRHWHLFAYSG